MAQQRKGGKLQEELEQTGRRLGRSMRQYDLVAEISQTCVSKRHRKAARTLNGRVVTA
jgi:hypothetical protein